MDPTAFPADLDLIPETLERLARRLESGDGLAGIATARAVLVIGMGSSGYAAEVVARHHRSLGGRVLVESASTVLLPDPSGLVVVAVSATGESAEVLDAVARLSGATVIAVTNKAGSTLAGLAQSVVELDAGVEASGIACRTFRATLVVLDVLLARLLGTRTMLTADQVRVAAQDSDSVLGRRGAWLEPLADLAGGPSGVWLLAPVERLSSARQGALMIREVSRRIAASSETGEWSHVDVYLAKTLDYRAVLFAGSAWDEQAAEWLRLRGSRFGVVGGGLAGSELRVDLGSRESALFTEPLLGELLAAHWGPA